MYKTILVHADESARSAQRIEIAARLALQYEAHLIGAAVTGLSAFFAPQVGLDPGIPAIVFPIDELRKEAERVLDQFDRLAAQAGVHSVERSLLDDEASAGISMQARYCDLVVISQSAPDEFLPRLRSDFPECVILNCARPVLVLPATGVPGMVGKRVTVAWNGSANALRAIASAIPMLQRADDVSVVVFNAGAEAGVHGEDPGADMATYLARHGIAVSVTSARTDDPGEALLSFAADHASDLIVMGAYGHSRFGEILLGGASRTALRSSPVALWMAH